jgi:hypothetical protein
MQESGVTRIVNVVMKARRWIGEKPESQHDRLEGIPQPPPNSTHPSWTKPPTSVLPIGFSKTGLRVTFEHGLVTIKVSAL